MGYLLANHMQKTVVLFMMLISLLSGVGSVAYGNEHVIERSTNDIYAEKGFLDIQAVTSERGEQFIPLQGQWEFYWKRLLEPEQLKQTTIEPLYIDVPFSWKNKTEWHAGGDAYGYGTYRIQVKVPQADIGKVKAVYSNSISSAFRIWIDGIEKPGLGTVGTSRAEETPLSHISLVFVEPKQEIVEIVIQVSNYSFREGGIVNEIVYGDTKALIVHSLKKMFNDIFIIGGFALIGLFHLALYGFRKKNPLTLLIALVTFSFSARTLILNGYLSALVLGIDSWETLVKLEYLIENIGFLFLIMLMKHMYPQEVNRYVLYVSYGVTALMSLFVLAVPPRIFTESMLLQTSVKAVILTYFVFYVGLLAYVRKREGAFINLTAVFVLIAAIINDMLYYSKLVNTVELFNLGAVLFVLAQAFVVSYRYARLSQKNDALVVELGEMNATLEQKVEQRTQKLHEINEQLSELKDMRTKMLVNIAHDLNSPLTGVQTYLQLMGKGLLPADRDDITRQLMEKTSYVQRLIRDLFDLSKLETREEMFDFETVEADGWLQRVYAQVEGELRQQQFSLQRGRWGTAWDGEQITVNIDRYRMMQVFRNYIDNAVKFSRDRSNVITMHVDVRESHESELPELVVEIADNGEGVSAEHLPYLFNRFYKKRTGNDEGSGLGLAIVAEIIEQHGGAVAARSVPGEGSVFSFTLPAAAVRAAPSPQNSQ